MGQHPNIAAFATAFAAATVAAAATAVTAAPQRRTPPPPAPAIRVNINGTPLEFAGQPPVEQEGRILVPLRGIFERLGASVRFDAAARTITAIKSGKQVVLRLGDTIAVVGNEAVPLNAPPQVIGGTTLVPLRFVSEALGARVDWDRPNLTVNINTDAVVAANLPAAPGTNPVFGQITGYYPESTSLSVRVPGGQNTLVPLTPEATLTVRGGRTAPTPRPLSELRGSLVGEQVRVERDGEGKGTRLTIFTDTRRGDLKSLTPLPNGAGYTATLTDGTVVTLRAGAGFTSSGRPVAPSDIKPGERVVIRVNPTTKQGESLDVVTPGSPNYDL
jgi:Copper amine oxidase N-terminal domain.